LATAPRTAKPAPKPSPKPAAKASPKAPAKAAPAAAGSAAEAPPAAAAVVTKRKDLVDRVTAEIGGRKGGVREIVEATLSEIGAALERGEDLLLPPLGRLRIVKSKAAAAGGAATLTLKLRRAAPGGAGKAGTDAKAPLADDDEDD
jgi:nucleoid DNA-binding protein